VPGGYRVQLARLLAARGIRVRFVGTIATNPTSGLTDAGQRHDGHPGWQSSEVLDHLAAWQVPRPDVILVHLGTNDLRRGHATPAQAAARLGHLLIALQARFPHASVVVAAIVPSGPVGQCDSATSEYDDLVRALVRQQAQLGHRVALADAWARFNSGSCSTRSGLLSGDRIHPSVRGYAALARTFAEVVAPLATSGRTLTP
jgi:lysophospholipase L1-like esterase